ncbi:MAG: ATP-dependent RNA helicase HrpA, partial [Lentisphaerae bacterium]|nr:ATP-dependent RNA helicase HrpA [Lentisphaerota bacterium]
RDKRLSILPDIRFPPELPITAYAAAITSALRDNPTIIVCGDTGSGKTTQLPKIALAAGRGRHGLIGCTQPRRLATLAMAQRVAEEFGQEPGGFVGYQHRFDKKLSRDSVIKFMTDGILLAETRRDRLFRAYDTLIIDEAHERSLNIDFLLGILKRVLARRRDLKLIISSATLDVQRFSDFFDGAPILSVPGRLYPIETRWRPADEEDDPDLPRQIAYACDELMAEGPGDILVFLPGERDIRDAAETLSGRLLPNTEIIPLLASLPAGEQQRAFRLSSNRRIILSTNVAETSVTLPGIRYVIDSGLVRLSRYNARTQVQRLQIEPISQASANQRQGRCGRLAPGICIRLYGEDDFRKRDPFTPPEIVRSSLAGVILTMLDLALGDIESFPFIDPPSPAMIREGYRELDMLGALESPPQNVSDAEKQKPAPVLSALGRRLARLPLDPALARILFAAHHEKALADALIVVAALECDDPRRRPIEKQTEADKLHARFLSPISDFAAVIRLWRWYHEQTAGTSQSRARRLCKDNFLSYPRLRDWIDLRAQLERLCTELQLNVTATSGGDHGLHRALLTGLLGNLGKRDPEASDYRGARGIRFAIFPGSGLAKLKEPRPTAVGRAASPAAGRRPAVLSRDWILAGELVETSRLFARTAACIDPAWIEPIAKRLCKSSYHSASWDATRGFVRVKERVTLFGLVLVEGRTRDYSRIEPLEARAIFIREGLVAGAFPAPVPPCLTANLARIRTLLDAEEKTRQHGALFDPETAFAFYDTRLPPELCSAADLRRWLRENATASDAMTLTEANLPPVRDLSYAYPDAVTLSGNRLALTYRHAQGEADDGITCTVPAALLTLAAAWRSEWLVPGLLDEKLRWMIHVLPTRYRRLLQPVDETLSMCRSRLTPGHRALAEAFSDALYAVRAVRVPTDNWNEESVPDHLRMRLVVQDEAGRELGSGRNIALLVKLFAPRCEGRGPAVQTPDSRWQKDGLTQWDFGALPAQLDVGKAGWPIIHYPALVDAGDTVSLRLFAAPAEAAAAHDKGVCRLFALALGKEWKRMIQPPSLPREVAAYLKQLDMSAERLGQELSRAALRETFTEGRPPVRDAAAFQERFDAERGRLHGVHLARTRLAVAVLHAARDVERDLLAAALPPDTQEDLAEQLAWLIFPGFAESIPSAQLQHLPRYLEACRVRIQRAQGNPHGDTRKLNELKPLWHRYTSHVALAEPPRHDPVLLAEYRWQIEELRVSLFAQELRTPAPVSAKRLDALWAQVLLP